MSTTEPETVPRCVYEGACRVLALRAEELAGLRHSLELTDAAHTLTLDQLAACRRLLREACAACEVCNEGWYEATLDDDWYEAARAAGGGE